MKKLLALITVAAMVAGVAVAANVVTRQVAPQKVAPVNTVKAEMSKASIESYLPTKIERPKASIARAITDDIDTLYVCPEGSYWVNRVLDDDGSISGYYGMLLPDGEVTWKNWTSGVDQSALFTWYSVDANSDGYYAESSDYDLVNTIKGDIRYVYPAPFLSLNGSDEGYQAQDGGNRVHWAGTISYQLDESGEKTSLMSNYNIIDYSNYSSLGRAYPSAKENQEYGWTGNEFWMEEFPDLGIEADTCIVTGICEHIPYAGRPYTLSKVSLLASIIGEEGAVLKCSLIPLGTDGPDFDNPIAETSITFGDEAVDYANLQLEFKFQNIDPVTGYPVDEPLVIDQDVLIYIDFSDDAFSYFAPYYNGVQRDFARVHGWDDVRYTAYSVVEYGSKKGDLYTPEGVYLGEAGGGYVWGSSSTGIYYLPCNFVVGFDLTYPYLYTDDEVEIEVAGEGESKDLTVCSNQESETFTVAGDETGEIDVPEWINVEFVDNTEESDGETYYIGEASMTITAEALPEGVAGRTADIYITIPTQVLKVTVKQGEVAEVPDLYVLGDFQGWKPNEGLKMTYNANAKTYTATITPQEEGCFKFTTQLAETEEWTIDEYLWGADSEGDFVVMKDQMGADLSLIAKGQAFRIPAGEWTLTASLEDGTLVIEGEWPEEAMYLAGSFTNWSEDMLAMEKGEDGLYTIEIEIAMPDEGNAEFKFVDEMGKWYGGVTDGNNFVITQEQIDNKTPLSLSIPGMNFELPIAGKYIITVDRENMTFTIEAVGGFAKGDVNGDGVVSGADVTALYNVLLDGAQVAGQPDVNGDGIVNGSDVTALYNLLLQ